MALAFDAVGPTGGAGQAASNPANLTWAHTVSGTQTALLVGVVVGTTASDATKTISSVTYNGVGMTQLALRHAADLAVGYVALYGLAGATTGANNVIVTFASAPLVGVAGSVSLNGADQSTPFGTPVTAAATSATATLAVASNTSGNQIFYVVGCGSNTGINPTSPATKRVQNNFSNSTGCGTLGIATIPATGSSVTCAWTVTSDSWADLAVEIKAAGAAVTEPTVVMAPMIPGGR